MDFFSHQEKARNYTKVLMVYFLIAMLLIVAAVNVVVYYFFIFLESYPYTPQNWFSEGLVYYVSGATILLIVSGSLFRWQKLKSGGHVVAEMLGASLLDLHTSDMKRRQLIHVIEEMSIASGVPLPVIYVMESESGINAFVAGYLPTEAVMVVSKGAIEALNREEMQGVVAHEYSHILNGDMQINIKLMAMLAGILMISLTGRLLMRGSSSRHHMSSRRISGNNKSGSALAVLGLLLLLVGYVGVFCGRLIKAAVSRQREFLADAAAVQFTRNPQGIASALNKIAESVYGSRIEDAQVEGMSHMCFSEAIKTHFNQWMATHPPLDKRISRVYPGFLSRIKARQMTENIQAAAQQDSAINTESPVSMFTSSEPVAMTSAQVSESVGKVDQAHIDYAASLHQSFSDELLMAIHVTETSKSVVWAMILAKMDLKSHLKNVHDCLGAENIISINKYKDEVFNLKDAQRLPLFDLLLPALKQMNKDDKADFIDKCKAVIKCDNRYTVFEFVILSLLQQHLSESAGQDVKVKYYSYKALGNELQMLLSVMSQSTGSASVERENIYSSIAKGFSLTELTLLPMQSISASKIQNALKKLSQMSPLLKRNVIEACADIAMDDGKLKSTEAELLRAISESLNCPMPPLLPLAE